MDGSGFSEDPDAEAKLLGGGLTTSSSSFLSLDNGVQGVQVSAGRPWSKKVARSHKNGQYELRTSCSSLSKSFSTAHSSAALRFRRPDSLEASLKHGIGQAMGAREYDRVQARAVSFRATHSFPTAGRKMPLKWFPFQRPSCRVLSPPSPVWPFILSLTVTGAWQWPISSAHRCRAR